jgi:hypothetical protein
MRLRVPDAVQRSSRCAAEPGLIALLTPDQQRTTPQRSGALRSLRGTYNTYAAALLANPNASANRP